MTTITACRACGAGRLDPVLSLGQTPLANSLLTTEDLGKPEPTHPLALVFCPACTLVQITETVPPDAMFREYLYFSSFSDTMLRHSEAIATRIARERGLGAGSLAMEVASNDGYLLQYYKRLGVPVLGIEPARNVAKVAIGERGIPTVTEFFGAELARGLAAEGKRADVLHANNVLAHVPDLAGFVAGIRSVLSDDGVAVIEVPYVRDMIDHNEFDTIYHEHLCYFSLTALDGLFARHELSIVDAETLPIHGGSIRVFASPGRDRARGRRVTALLADERRRGMTSLAYYSDFARRVDALKRELVELLGRLRREGKRIAAYGAAAKGSTLLNYFGIGRETVEFVVDRSTHKQGRFMPGVHVPIFAPDELVARMPDYTLLLTWNFADEILAQQSEYRAKGGKFIVPVPNVRVV